MLTDKTKKTYFTSGFRLLRRNNGDNNNERIHFNIEVAFINN